MYRYWIVFLLTITLFRVDAFTLDENYEIVLPNKPAAVEQTAAKELQHYLRKVAGLQLSIVQENTSGAKKAIHLGWNAEVRRRLQGEALPETFAPDEIIVRSFPDGTLVMTGEGSRGTLYAVYTFLEDILGIRWFTPDVESVPHREKIEVPELAIRYAPPIAVRSPGGALFQPCEPAFLAHMRVNGHSTSAQYGGNEGEFVLCNRSHTMCRLVPDEAFYHSHKEYYDADYCFPGTVPELFAWHDGRRITGEPGQPCLTNPQVKALVIANSSKLLRRLGQHAKSFLITQNDNTNYCRCSNCKKLVTELGSQTDLLLWFLNDVAAELEKEFPGLIIETLAYQYTLEPPKRVKPRSNIRIRLCLIEADSRLSLTAETNSLFRDILTGWHEVTTNLAVWHYITNFTNFGLIHPNFQSLGPKLRCFSELGVRDVFSQDSQDAGVFGFFPELRGYLNAKLLWNPELDQDMLTEEFMNGYYGNAAIKLRKYIDLNAKALARADTPLDCYEMDTAIWLPWSVLRQGDKLLAEAAGAVVDDPIRKYRVEWLRTAHDWTRLWRIETSPLQRLLPQPQETAMSDLRQTMANRLSVIPKTPGYKGFYLKLGVPLERALIELDRHLTPTLGLDAIPTELRSFAPGRLVPIPPGYYTLLQSKTVMDYLAPAKQAIRLHLGNHNWALLVNLPAAVGVKPVKIFAELRLPEKVTAAKGIAAFAGVYVYGTNFAEKSVIPIEVVTLSNSGYALVPLGETDFRRDHQIYFEGADNPSVPELLLARIWLVKK